MEANTLTESLLSKSKMAFQLPDDKGYFIIDELDIKSIASKLMTEMLLLNPERVMMLHDTGLARAKQLYEVYQKEKTVMSEKLQQDCLLKIVKFLSENDYELTTLKDKLDVKR